MPNRLANSSSPYLLQHKDNPVDWYEWSDDALARARQDDKPIFLSIGYSACHWCHVMEHESFENEAIAAIMNEHFICIKVDREQRPDLDQIYMQAVQMMTGSGGWPMSVFLTPDTRPFYGGTYWPPENKFGRPGFPQVLNSVTEAWKNKRDAIEKQGDELVGFIQDSLATTDSEDGSTTDWEPTLQALATINDALLKSFEPHSGGFGGAPKFPHATDLTLLIRLQHRQPNEQRQHVIDHTLLSMASGGIYDQLGGGFARYSVDNDWLVPHFEKMLYDNALLTVAFAEAYQLTGNPRYATTVRDTLKYLTRDMRNAAGGFHSAEDADSEGVEGKFYVWSREEIIKSLGQSQGELFCETYDVTFSGNFEGSNILHRVESIETLAATFGLAPSAAEQSLAESREKLLAIRSERTRPGLDDKALTGWNALAISAFARASIALGDSELATIAVQATEFIQSNLIDASGRLLHVWRNGKSEIRAFLDDYAYWIDALVLVAEASGQLRFLDTAKRVAEEMIQLFSEPNGAFYYTASDSETLIARSVEWADHSIPSSNGSAASALIRLGIATGSPELEDRGKRVLSALQPQMNRAPAAAGQLWLAADLATGPAYRDLLYVPESASIEQKTTESATQEVFRSTYAPHSVRLIIESAAEETNNNESAGTSIAEAIRTLRPPAASEPILVRCQGSTCQAPIVGSEAISAKLTERD
jgi:uncharacterized protein YyaL (SSP411 family)